MTTVAARRSAVVEARSRFAGLSERRACMYLGVPLSSHRYRSVRRPDTPLREALREVAGRYVRWGFPMLLTLLRRDGWADNHKRVERIHARLQARQPGELSTCFAYRNSRRYDVAGAARDRVLSQGRVMTWSSRP